MDAQKDAHIARLEDEKEQRARLTYVAHNYMTNFLASVHVAQPEELEATTARIRAMKDALDDTGLRNPRVYAVVTRTRAPPGQDGDIDTVVAISLSRKNAWNLREQLRATGLTAENVFITEVPAETLGVDLTAKRAAPPRGEK